MIIKFLTVIVFFFKDLGKISRFSCLGFSIGINIGEGEPPVK